MFQFPGFAFINLCIQSINTCLTSLLAAHKCNNNKVSGGLPHSEISGYNGYSHLPKAYRRVSRPSSPLTAKAFTKRPSRAWFDPEEDRPFVYLTSSPRRGNLDQKHTFPRFLTVPKNQIADVGLWSVKKHMFNPCGSNTSKSVLRTWTLVSVLDLDNIVVSGGIP